MGRNRSAKNKGLPPNLYLRKGIFYYRDVRTQKEFSVGSNKSSAITEAIQANLVIYKPNNSLMQRINNIHIITLHEWMDIYKEKLNARELKEKTLSDYSSRINVIKLNFDEKDITEITARDIATFISSYPKKINGKTFEINII